MFFWTKKRKYLLFLAIGIVVLGGTSGVIAFFTTKNQNKKSKINEIITTNKIAKESNNHKNTFYRPFQFRELEKIGKGQPIMFKGIGYDAYMFGTSFLLNIAWKLGFNLFENEGEITKDGNVKNVDYYNNYNQAKIEEEKSNENPKEILKAFKSFKQHPLGNNYWKHWVVWQVFAVMDPFGIDGNLDMYLLDVGGVNHIWSFKEVGQKKGLFKFVGGTDPKQQFGAYSFWQMIDGSGPKPTQKTSPQKKGMQQDGVGVITGVNISNSHPLKGSLLSKLLNSESKLTKKGEKWSFNYHFRSIKNLRPRYVVVSQKKIEEIKMLYLAIIKNLKSYLDKNKKIAIIDNLHPIIARFFQFLRNLNIKDKKVVAKIKQAIDELNNGSHNLLSAEIFARGIKNVPMLHMPIPSNLVLAYLGLKYSKTGVGEIEGLASTNNIESTLLKMFHSTKKGYSDQDGNASTKDNLMFDPKASKSLTIKGFDFTNQRSISGQEVKLMGGLVQKKVYKKWWNDYQVWLNDKSLKKPVLKYVDENL